MVQILFPQLVELRQLILAQSLLAVLNYVSNCLAGVVGIQSCVKQPKFRPDLSYSVVLHHVPNEVVAINKLVTHVQAVKHVYLLTA